MKTKLLKLKHPFWASVAFVVPSLAFAFYVKYTQSELVNTAGFVFLAFWVLVPPVWFLYEYVKEFPEGHKRMQEEVDRLRHLQDLARNLWLALVIVLTAIMGIKWPVG